MDEMNLNAKQGSKKDMEMRQVLIDQVEQAHAIGKPRILKEANPGFSLEVAELKMTRDQLKKLRDALHGTLIGFFSANSDVPAEEAAAYNICLSIYPGDTA